MLVVKEGGKFGSCQCCPSSRDDGESDSCGVIVQGNPPAGGMHTVWFELNKRTGQDMESAPVILRWRDGESGCVLLFFTDTCEGAVIVFY